MKHESMAKPAAALLAPVLMALLLSCGRPEPTGGAPSPAAPIPVRTARVTGGSESWIEVPGTVEAARAADIASRVAAVVERVRVEEGTSVREGELLIALDGRDLRARAQAAEAALKAATAQQERVRELFARDASTRQELEAAEAVLAAARAERDVAEAQIEYVEIRAPFAGTIVGKWTRAGDLTTPGRPLLSLQGAGPMRVTASVAWAQAEGLTPGAPLQAVLEGGEIVAARVSAMAPAGDPASLRFLVKADISENSGARVGSFARLRLPRGHIEPTPMVPRSALIEKGALTGVFIVEEGRARLRFISPGETAGEMIYVRSGVDEGEEVVLHPGTLGDGARVERRP